MPPNNKKKTDQALIDKQNKALDLHRGGMSFDDIAKELKYANRSGAWKAVRSALLNHQAPHVEKYREYHLIELKETRDIIDKILKQKSKKKIISNDDAMILARFVRDRIHLQKRESKLLGLDMPENIHITTEEPISSVMPTRRERESKE